MGRTATIDKSDVLRARDTLRQGGLPHGIIAIRKQLGRGSPTLIARLLRELDGQSTRSTSLPQAAVSRTDLAQPVRESTPVTRTINTPPTPRQESSETAWQTIIAKQQTEQDEWRRALLDKDLELQRMRNDQLSLEQRVASAETKNAMYATQISILEGQLESQRRSFDASRHDQNRDRAILAARLEQLTRSLEGAKRPSLPILNSAAGEQLDLYGEQSVD
ncbi:MAG: hypothetical protein ACI9BW_002939 [Gammaproteobacteria bacterium]|jgi:hypothetical protein